MKILRYASILALTGFVTNTPAFAQSNTHQGHGEHAGHGSVQDAKFLDKMSKHHQDGIKMAEMARTKATNPEVKQMSEKIVTDQTAELEQMKKWRTEHLADVKPTGDEPKKMDMSSLEKKTGKEFDRAYLDMMVKHHSDGVRMAKDMAPNLHLSEVKKFAETSITKQGNEINQMKTLKKSL